MRHLLRIILIGCTCVVLTVSATELLRTIRYIDITYVNENFSSSDNRMGSLLSDYAAASGAIVQVGECRSDILQAGVGVVLANLDRIDPDLDFQKWVDAAKHAEQLLQHASTCAPFVSEYWLRYAMVKRAAGEVPNEQALLLSRAVDLDPASAAGLRGRFALWRKYDALTLAAAEPALRRDLTTLLRFASPSFVRDVLKDVAPPLRSYVSSVVSDLTEERRQRLVRWSALPS